MQPDLFTPAALDPAEGITQADLADLRYRLHANTAWQTREQLCAHLQWSERKLRAVAATLGAEIVRASAGFKLTDHVTRDDTPLILEAINRFESQSKKMATYAHALRQRLHSLIG